MKGRVDDQVRMQDPARGLYEKTAQHHQLHQLQAHDQLDVRVYEEFLDGIGQGGEGGNYVDLDGGAGLEAVVNGGALRLGSRASRSRQIVDRRERESRREGKWERKQN